MEAPLSDSGYRQELERRLGLGHLIVFGLIFMVPIAPMAVYGFVAKQSYGMVPLVYLVGMTAMFFTVMSYRQLSREFPIAGSVYSYVQRGLHPYAGFVAGWLIVADYLLVPSLIYAFAASWLHGLLPGVPLWVWIAAFIGANSAINVLGIELQARANFVLLAVQLVALALFLV
ncbi:MAG: APC family permease, partial [Proteobacteria bacterium]|nr:APC family permease [Pseudomonadota bacterium]